MPFETLRRERFTILIDNRIEHRMTSSTFSFHFFEGDGKATISFREHRALWSEILFTGTDEYYYVSIELSKIKWTFTKESLLLSVLSRR